MDNKQLIDGVLSEQYPLECEAVGPTNVNDIVKGGVEFAAAEHGSYMDFSEAIATLVVAATFIKAVLEAYATVKKEMMRDPKKDELEIRIVTSNEVTKSLNDEARDQLVDAVIRKLSDRGEPE